MSELRLAGRRYLVTGAGSGIGRATVLRLLREGADVLAADILDEGLASLYTEAARPGQLLAHVLDSSDATAWPRVAKLIAERWGVIDGGLLNVGKNRAGRLHELPLDEWEAAISLNLHSNVYGFRTVAPLCSERASLVFTTSIHASVGFSGFPAYAAAKGALTALTRQLAVDYAPRLRVNAIAPGSILTAAWSARDEDFRANAARHVPLGRLGRPEEIAGAAAFLLSDDASYITGQTLVVDGGRTISSHE